MSNKKFLFSNLAYREMENKQLKSENSRFFFAPLLTFPKLALSLLQLLILKASI